MLNLALRLTIAVLSAGFSIALAGLAVVLVALWFYGRDLPDYQKLASYEPPIVSRLYAADGSLIGEFASEKRIFVPYGAIPKRVVQAFVSAEDQRFFAHPGVDVIAIARALHAHFIEGGRLRGGSTITQQVTKNFFLSPRRSVGRKIREMILAFRIEHAYAKGKILEVYLNQIFLGRQAYGVAAAAQVYFGKALAELTVAEAAFLAALPQAPSRFNPERRARLAATRRNYVIQRMREDGYVTQREADEAEAAPLGIRARPPRAGTGAEYFVEEVRREMLAKYGDETMKAGGFVVRSTLDPKLQDVADAALRRGLVAYDRRHGWRGPLANLKEKHGRAWAEGWRKKLRAHARAGLPEAWQLALVLNVDAKGADIGLAAGGHGRIPLAELTWARNQGEAAVAPGKPAFRTAKGPPVRRAGDVLKEGDVVLVEPVRADERDRPVPEDTFALRQLPEVTGGLVAMDPHTGRVLAMSGGFGFEMRQFNNVTQAWRQPGSSFKPYVYLAALAKGFTPSTMILDAPLEEKVGDKVYRPRNYADQFFGPVTMRTALRMSLNSATLRLAEATGLGDVAAMAAKLGVSDKLDPVPSMALGAIETTLLRQVTAYSMIANGGKKITPTLVDRIQDRYGRTVDRHDRRPCGECGQIAYRGQSMPSLPDRREQVLDEDNAYQIVTMLQDAAQRSPAIAALGRRVAGKTGTTNDGMDSWLVGFSPDLAVAVWIGFDAPRSLGPTETGAMTAGPIFADFMRAAMQGKPWRDFVRPTGIVVVGSGRTAEYYKRGTENGPGRERAFVGYQRRAAEPDPDAADAGSDERGYEYGYQPRFGEDPGPPPRLSDRVPGHGAPPPAVRHDDPSPELPLPRPQSPAQPERGNGVFEIY